MGIPNEPATAYTLLVPQLQIGQEGEMSHKVLSVFVGGLAAVALFYGVANADPGHGHGPPPGKGPKGTPGVTNPGNPGNPGKGACVKACQQDHRDCIKTAATDRKTCYQVDCADERAAVQACEGGGDGVTDQGTDGVTDQGGGCSALAKQLTQCLKNCRATASGARKSCGQGMLGCKGDNCGLPVPPTVTPTPDTDEAPNP